MVKSLALRLCTQIQIFLLIDETGKIIRLPANEVRAMGRQAKGVRLIKLDEGQQLSTLVAFQEGEEGEACSMSGIPAPKKAKLEAGAPGFEDAEAVEFDGSDSESMDFDAQATAETIGDEPADELDVEQSDEEEDTFAQF